MDEFEYYCQLARSTNNNNNNNNNNKTDNRNFLNPKSSESPYRIRSQSLLPTDFENSCKEELYCDNRRDSLQPTNFRNRSIKENRSHNSLKHTQETIEVFDEGNQNLYRVRSLKKTSKGVISKGDSIRNHSNNSLDKQDVYPCTELHSSNINPKRNSPQVYEKKKKDALHIKQTTMPNVTFERSREDSHIHWHSSFKSRSSSFNIQVVGAPLVGKSSMCEQFLTSECLGDSAIPEKDNESRTVTIDLDNREWKLTFLDTVRDEDDDPNNIQIYHNADGYMIVYAIDEYDSFEYAKIILNYIRCEIPPDSALFLVANKSDLERGREISSDDGKHLAKLYDCEFLEISTALNHMVDDLIVKIIHKICYQKEKYKKDKREECTTEKKSKSHTKSITNFFRKHFSKQSQSTIDNH